MWALMLLLLGVQLEPVESFMLGFFMGILVLLLVCCAGAWVDRVMSGEGD